MALNFLSRILNPSVVKSSGHTQALSYIKEWIRGLDLIRPTTGTIASGEEYNVSPWVFRCINVWMQLANVPLRMVQEDKGGGTSKVVTTGAVHDLLRSPNSQTGQRQFLEKIIFNLALHGRCLILREDGTNYNGLPAFLQFLDMRKVYVKDRDIDAMGFVTAYTVRDKGREYRYDSRGVIPLGLPHGVSPITALRLSIDADYAARMHNSTMMRNHGRIGGIVSFDDPNITVDQMRDFRKLWDETYSGPENTGKTAFLSRAEYQAINQSMKDLDWLNAQYINREEICAAFGVPLLVAGDFRFGTYANYEQASKELWNTCLIPMGGRILDVLQKHIVDGNQKPPAMLQFDYAAAVPALRDDTGGKIAQYIQLVQQGFVTPEVASKIVGLNIGEISDVHRTTWTTFNLVPAESSLAGPEPAPEPEPPTKQLRKQVEKLLRDMQEEKPEDHGENHDDDEDRVSDHGEQLRILKWKALMSIRVPYERKFSDVMKAYFYRQRTAMLSRVDAAMENMKTVGNVTTRAWTAQQFVDAVMGSIEDWNKDLVSSTDAITEAAIEASAKDVLRDLGKSPSDYKRLSLERYREQRKEILSKVNETTRERLIAAASKIEQAIREGQSVTEAAESMKSAIRGELAASEGRRRVIARTEMGRAFEAARDDQMREAGVTRKQWLSSRDPEVRDSHNAVDGEIVGIDDAFSNGLQYPGDVDGPPEETINCRCTSLPVLDDEET